MKYTRLSFFAAVLVALGITGLVGCGDDDDVTKVVDGGVKDGEVKDGEVGVDGGGKCDFNAFVTNLINTQTTATAVPSTDLGEGCTDTRTPFPAALFQ